MNALVGILLGLLVSGTSPAHRHAECPCPSARESHGWCDVCEVGYVGFVEIASKTVYETLDAHGHRLDLDSFHCPTCKKAIASEGFCDEHRIGFVDDLAYFSRLTYHLARGTTNPATDIACAPCARDTETPRWCEECGVGRVGNVLLHDREAFRHVERALRLLHKANELARRCEPCAAALLTDSECPVCRIRYEAGAPVPRAPSSGKTPPDE